MHPVKQIEDEAPPQLSHAGAGEFSFLDLLVVLAARKRIICLSALSGFVLALGAALLRSPTFTAQASIMPPQRGESSASALLGEFGALASISGASGSLSSSLKDPADLYIGILKSETVEDSLIRQFDLMRLYRARRMSQARRRLASNSKFVNGKEGLISIAVEDHDPKRAAAMANAYVSELHDINTHLAITEASQKRLFFEQQLAQEKDKLADAEVALKQTEESTGVIEPTGQTEVAIRQIAQVQAEITMDEVQLDALHTSSTDQNPEVVRLNSSLDGLRAELRDLEGGAAGKGGKRGPGDISIATANVPQLGLEYIRKERDVKYHQLLFDILARQYEAARLDEAKAAPVIQVVDPALVPDWKSGPSRAIWAIVGGFLGFLLGSGWILGSRAYRRVQADPEQGSKFAMLKHDLGLRG
jgi:tyrosine-protein kinase Etk/Wzc